jgi:hypothetical protein
MIDSQLKTTSDLNWCIDILKRIDDILKKPNVSDADLSQIHWLIKQALKVEKEDE